MLILRLRGNLSNKSLTTIVDPSLIIQNSEYLETHLVAVPRTITKDFLKTYETISPWIVPRSAQTIDSDDEFTLYAVTTFKKHSADFIHKCRENKWTPRDFKYKEGGREEEQKEVERLEKDESKVRNEAWRLGRTSWGEAVMAWVHVLALRVFVETVLRYGLPLQFVCGLIRVCQILATGGTYQFRRLLTSFHRLHQNLRRRQEARWMLRTHILEVKLLAEIEKAGLPRTILRHRRICRRQGIRVTEGITRRTSVMSSRFHEATCHYDCVYSHRGTAFASIFMAQAFVSFASKPCFSRYSTICTTASSTPVSPLLMTTSAFSGSS